MITTDTRAALDAAILKYGGDAATSYEFHARPPDDRDLNAAITAHVEAEIARRLAVAPGVEAALAAYGTAVYELGYVLHRPDRDAVLRPAKDAADSTLRAAIAADRERAVSYATAHMRPMVSREQAAQLVARFEESIGHELRRRIDGDRKDLIDALTGGEDAPARPAPDEARRLVEEYGNAVVACIPAIEAGARGDGDAVNAMADVIDRGNKTLAALLRALGVEA